MKLFFSDEVTIAFDSHCVFTDRKQYQNDPVVRGEFHLQAGESAVELGVVSCGDTLAAYNMEAEEFQLQKYFEEAHMDVEVELRTLSGGQFPFDDDFDGGNEFLQADYDNNPGRAQYAEQNQLGSQHIFQFVPKADQAQNLELSAKSLDTAMEKVMERMKAKVSGHHHVTDIGDGCLIAFFTDIGNAILVWDGREHIDVNFFFFKEDWGATDVFVASFIHFNSAKHVLEVGLRDDMPRGTGRVINFERDRKDQ